MGKKTDRRKWRREILEPPKSGIIYHEAKGRIKKNTNEETDTIIVNVLNISKKGVMLQSPFKFKINSPLDMRLWHPARKIWLSVKGQVRWVRAVTSLSGYYFSGVAFSSEDDKENICSPEDDARRKKMSPDDLDFLLHTSFFKSIPDESICPLLNSLSYYSAKAGERIIVQGEIGDKFYIIRKGSCIVSLEKEGVQHSVARLIEGDIVGEMAVLTGERRTTNVDAETDIELWGISRAHFDLLAADYPDIRNFLTEIITQRFDTTKVTADKTIGKYVIREIAGHGGWSIVYKGVHSILNFPVAIKMLKHNMAMDSDFLEKFRNEAKTIAKLNHRNIVKVYDIEELYRTIFIVMEYLDGYTLEYKLERMPRLKNDEILSIFYQICKGLEFAHENGIIHQDIKPANIFIMPDGTVKIVDFGLACNPGNIDFNLPGTVFYMAPEQIQGNPVDERTDIYSLGIMFYEMLTGERPFPEDNISNLMDLHLEEDIQDPRHIVNDVPESLSRIVMRCSRRNPDERYNNISELIAEIKPLIENTGIEDQKVLKEKTNMIGMYLFYKDEQQNALNKIMDKFYNEISETGIDVKIAYIQDI